MTGVDINAEFVERAGKRAAAAGLESSIDYRCCEFPPLPFADGSFDRVWCKNVLEYVDDAAATMAEMARVTAPGGIVTAVDSDWEMMALEMGEETRERTESHPGRRQIDCDKRAAHRAAIVPSVFGRGTRRMWRLRVFANPDRRGLMAGMLRNSIARYALDSHKVSASTVQQWLRTSNGRFKAGRYLFLLPQFLVSGRKPAAHG